MSVLRMCAWIENTPVAAMVRESEWGFPILVAIHIFGLFVSVGTLVWYDLRLLGVSMPACPVSEVYRRLMPWTLSGFVVMVVSGGLLFSGFATSAYANVFFRVKLAALTLAAVNALFFHLATERRIAEWNEGASIPVAAKLAGLISLAAWATVIMAGRMMSYTMF